MPKYDQNVFDKQPSKLMQSYPEQVIWKKHSSRGSAL